MTTETKTTTPVPARAGRFKRWVFRTFFPERIEELFRLHALVTELRSELARSKEDFRREFRARTEMLKKSEAEFDRQGRIKKEEARDWRRSAEELTEEELVAAFDIEADEELWLAVHQVLDQAIQQAVEEATMAPGNPPQGKFGAEDRAFAAGGVDFLRELQRELISRRAKSRVKSREAVAGEEEKE